MANTTPVYYEYQKLTPHTFRPGDTIDIGSTPPVETVRVKLDYLGNPIDGSGNPVRGVPPTLLRRMWEDRQREEESRDLQRTYRVDDPPPGFITREMMDSASLTGIIDSPRFNTSSFSSIGTSTSTTPGTTASTMSLERMQQLAREMEDMARNVNYDPLPRPIRNLWLDQNLNNAFPYFRNEPPSTLRTNRDTYEDFLKEEDLRKIDRQRDEIKNEYLGYMSGQRIHPFPFKKTPGAHSPNPAVFTKAPPPTPIKSSELPKSSSPQLELF